MYFSAAVYFAFIRKVSLHVGYKASEQQGRSPLFFISITSKANIRIEDNLRSPVSGKRLLRVSESISLDC